VSRIARHPFLSAIAFVLLVSLFVVGGSALVVWRAAHAWFMSGFESTADPAYSNRYRVTKAFIQDPWYPAISSIWGASRPPNAGVSVRALGQDYLRYDRPGRRHPKRDGRYMLILPTVPKSRAAG